ncbi:hypothetical protein P5V15_012853 [Pogonomyrmex californicus]
MAERQTEETGTGQEETKGRRVISARKRACTRAEGPEASPNLEEILCLTLEELRFLREERARRETETFSMPDPQEEISQRPISGQSFPFSNFSSDLKLKPDTYDGNVPLREYLTQFNLIARANNLGNTEKAVVLASCLRGKARAILEGGTDFENSQFENLVARLELRFGENLSLQNYYYQFTNRKQRFGEDLAALGSDIERLSRLAYPECSPGVRDKIACS